MSLFVVQLLTSALLTRQILLYMRGSQRVSPKQHVQGSDLEAMYSHSYPQCAFMCQVIRQCIYANTVYVWFQRWKNERLSPATLAIFLIHVSYNMITNTQKNAHAHLHITKELVSALSACQWLHSPRSWDGLRDTATVSLDPHRQHWDEKLIITLCSQVNGRGSQYEEERVVEWQ